jgi:ATP-binding cassette subfamily C protein CydC
MKQAFHFVAMMWHQQRRWILAGAVASALAVLAAVALLALSGWFITAAALAGLAGAGLSFDFFRPSAAIRFLALFRTAARYGERLITHDATLRFFASLRADLFKSVAAAPESRRFGSAELLQRLTGDLDAIDALYLRVLLPAAVAVAVAALTCGVLFYLSISFSVAIGTAFLGSALALFAGALAAKTSARRSAIGTEALRVRTVDMIHAQPDLLLSGGLDNQKARISKAALYLSDASNRLARIEIVTSTAIALGSAALVFALVLLAGTAFEARAIEGPVMALVVIGGLASLEVFAPMRRGAIEIGRIAFSGRRLHRLWTGIPESDRRIAIKRGPAVAALGLTFRHGNAAKPIFENFYFAARNGERVTLTGKSGCGKSTLLSLIAGLVQSERGNILIHDDASAKSVVGLLTQRTELFNGSIEDNLRIAAPKASESELWHALEVVELHEKIEGLDGRLSWRLGESGSGLSGGEQRRLALARLVLRNPQIWLMDEPTAGMDEALARRVLANLLLHAPNATWIVAAHYDREIAISHRVVRMDAGPRHLT